MITPFVVVSSLLVASVTGSNSCTKHCSHHTHSVCGTDGKNYKNLCYLSCEASHNNHLALLHNGTCTSVDTATSFNCDNLCDDEGQQEYCASDGVTYESMCDLQNAACAAARNHHHVTASHLGPCLTLSGGCAWYNASCPRTNDYKCGSTGYTYRNGCYLKQAQCRQIAAGSVSPVTLLHDGKCGYASTNHSRNVNCTHYADMSLVGVAIEGLTVRISAHCSHYHNAICVDGIDYSSDCYVCYKYAQAGKIISTVTCNKCSKHCNNHGPSVCGTDGKNYKNQCHLDIAICQANRHGFTLALAHNSSCGSLDKLVFHCDALCDEEGQKSYCASNGNTYESICDLKNAECVAARHNHHLTVLHPGTCLTLNGTCARYNASCPRTHDYKCGTTGYTYMNECYLKQAQCQQLAAGSPSPVTLLHDGRCAYNSTEQSINVDCSKYADMSLTSIAIEGLSVKINDCPSTHNQQVCANGITFSNECRLCYRAARAHKISYDNLVIPIAHDGQCHFQPIVG